MRKKIILILMFVLIVYCLSGCATITYYDGMTEYGEMTRRLVVKINEDELYKDEAYEFAKLEVEARVQESEFLKIEYDDEGYTITITEYYANVTDFYIEYGITGDEKNEDDTPYKINGFFKDYLDTEKIIFSQQSQLVDVLLDDYQAYGFNYFNINELTLNHIYARPYKNIKSNADSVVLLNDLYEHKWTTNLNDMDDVTLALTTRYPFAPMWYGSALVFSIVIAVIAVFVKKYYDKNKANENVQEQ